MSRDPYRSATRATSAVDVILDLTTTVAPTLDAWLAVCRVVSGRANSTPRCVPFRTLRPRLLVSELRRLCANRRRRLDRDPLCSPSLTCARLVGIARDPQAAFSAGCPRAPQRSLLCGVGKQVWAVILVVAGERSGVVASVGSTLLASLLSREATALGRVRGWLLDAEDRNGPSCTRFDHIVGRKRDYDAHASRLLRRRSYQPGRLTGHARMRCSAARTRGRSSYRSALFLGLEGRLERAGAADVEGNRIPPCSDAWATLDVCRAHESSEVCASARALEMVTRLARFCDFQCAHARLTRGVCLVLRRHHAF